MRNQLAFLAILSFFWTAAAGCATEPPRRPELTSCKEPYVPAEARCGTFEVFENRATRTGRKIPLRIVVLPATGPGRLSDPFVYFAGGPGDASILEGLSVVGPLVSLRQKRDVLLVDLRGTGESGGLYCPELQDDESLQGFLDEFLPVDKIRACRDRLKKEADLSWYTTDAAIDDVEEVRTALGYGPLNLMGGSYGTRAVLTYVRRHPGSVRTATLLGIVPPEERYPMGIARATQLAFDGLIAECEGDAACRGAFPQLRQEVDTVLRRAAAEPVRVELAGPPGSVRLGRNGLAQALRYRLYSPAEAALLPLAIHQAAQGNWKPLAEAVSHDERGKRLLADGFYQSVTCAEDLAFIRDEEIAPAVAGTFLGDFRVRAQKAACEGWPIRDLGPDVHAPVISDVPALLISGERDPATPASEAARVARTFERSRHLVIADGAHSMDGMQGADCLLRLITRFIEAGSVEGLDTSCIAGIRRPEFALRSVLTSADPEMPVNQADLERLPGSYANQEMGLTLKVDLGEGQLHVSVTQGPPFPPFLLIPSSPTRFRVQGEGLAPGLTVAFQVAEGKATALIMAQPGVPEVVLQRRP
jgi:pimeloyl-ACP methyl ester carboxylesterase